MQTENLIKELPIGLIAWYEFHKESKVLYVTDAREEKQNLDRSLVEYLRKRELSVEVMSIQQIDADDEEKYDYIILIDTLEWCKQPEQLLQILHNKLSDNGRLLLGTDNRLGIRYFCGDRDKFTGRSFDSIENYARVNSMRGDQLKGRAYAKGEIVEMLEQAGFMNHKFYSVLPELTAPQVLYAEDYLPKEELEMRIAPQYNCPDIIFLEEERLYTTLIQNGLFHIMANGYFIECALEACFEDVQQVTVSIERGKEDAMCTVICENNVVEKRAVYPEGKKRLEQLVRNNDTLKEHGIAVVEAKLENGKYVMPYEDAELAVIYLRKLLCADKDKFIMEMDRFREQILHSSKIIKDSEEDGTILERAYFDMVPINCFYINGEFVFFDQEFVIENYPADVIVLRMVEFIYHGNSNLETYLPQQFFLNRYGLTKNLGKWNEKINSFLEKLRKEKELHVYHEKKRCNSGTIFTNRQRINYSEAEYQRLFVDIFSQLDGKKLIIFGSGSYAKKFITLYGKKYAIDAIIDNNEAKWGSCLEGISIKSPEIISGMDKETYKVIICIKNYPIVLQQLQDMEVKHIGIYDINRVYTITTKENKKDSDLSDTKRKKYHTGYIAGVFDLFHIGHLNMFKRAKEQCEYLIVGVVSDEGVRNYKKTDPFIPFKERIEMVRSCRYVDEAVEIPVNYGGTRDAYRMYHFDVQFSGNDYENDGNWLAEREFLRKQGADMVFFPYTEQTSSTKIKALINKQLEEK